MELDTVKLEAAVSVSYVTAREKRHRESCSKKFLERNVLSRALSLREDSVRETWLLSSAKLRQMWSLLM